MKKAPQSHLVLPRLFILTPILNTLLKGKRPYKVYKGTHAAVYLGLGVWYDACTFTSEKEAKKVVRRLSNWVKGVHTYNDLCPSEDLDTKKYLMFLDGAEPKELDEDFISYASYERIYGL